MSFITQIDTSITQYMATVMKNPFLDFIMPYITLLAEAGVFWIAIAIVLLCRKSTRKFGIILALAIIFNFLACNVLIKNIVGRLRPDPTLWNDKLIFLPGGYSFPSGHTSVSFASAGALTYFNRKIGIAALIIAALVGFSRIYLCVHYFSDVVTGAVLGIAMSVLAVLLVEKMYKNPNRL